MGTWKKTQYSFSNGNQFLPPNQSVFGRNLTKDQLGGVIFGCKNATIKECLTKQLFGLPAQHFSYVKNIRPGLPLFLFNYTDRMLHGIFEAACNGRMLIDRYGWTDGSDSTQFPAQVQIRVQLQCRPLSEDKFKPVIADNYYHHNHFWFELDHGQTSQLISLLKPLAITPRNSVPQNSKWTAVVSRYLPPQEPAWKTETFKMPESEFEHRSTHSSTKSGSIGSDFLFDEYSQPLDTHSIDKEETKQIEKDLIGSDLLFDEYTQPLDTHTIDEEEAKQNEKDLIWMKLKELTLSRENQDLSWENNVSDTPYANESCFGGKHSEKEENTSSPSEKEENPSSSSEKEENTSSPSEKEENPSSSSEKEENFSSPLEHQYNIAQLVQEIKELTDFKKTQTERNNYLEQKLIEAELEIQLLKDRCTLLESTHNAPSLHIEETVINPSAKLHLDAKDSIYLIGGSDGQSSLASMDQYCTSQNVIQSLKPMNYLRSYASVVELNGEIYVFGGGNDCDWYDSVESYNPIHDNWTLRPSLKQKKGSLAGAALKGKIFAVGGGNGFDCFSDVEMLDLDIGRWIPTRSMIDKRFALAAVELNGAIYATGGFDGKNYLNTAERFDPREHSWFKIASMNTKRGCHSIVALNEKLYALGGFDGETMVPSVEVFDPRLGTWTVVETMNHPRGYFAAAVVKDSIYVIGGVKGCQTIVDTVENYKEDNGWKETYTSLDVKRCFMSAIACTYK
ncbi:uncharacterized protein [Cicer arietinum]|nr:uncharacterized protein LOC101507160 isoform X2 [Cicer arietinum]XP_012569089.1 uncharacterized protein LOC101507160 isoform X2 [Cicer arietinum]